MSRQRDLIASAIRGMQGLTETAGGSYRKATERAQAKTQSIREDLGVDTKGAAKGVASLVTSGDGKKEKKNKEKKDKDEKQGLFGRGKDKDSPEDKDK